MTPTPLPECLRAHWTFLFISPLHRTSPPPTGGCPCQKLAQSLRMPSSMFIRKQESDGYGPAAVRPMLPSLVRIKLKTSPPLSIHDFYSIQISPSLVFTPACILILLNSSYEPSISEVHLFKFCSTASYRHRLLNYSSRALWIWRLLTLVLDCIALDASWSSARIVLVLLVAPRRIASGL